MPLKNLHTNSDKSDSIPTGILKTKLPSSPPSTVQLYNHPVSENSIIVRENSMLNRQNSKFQNPNFQNQPNFNNFDTQSSFHNQSAYNHQPNISKTSNFNTFDSLNFDTFNPPSETRPGLPEISIKDDSDWGISWSSLWITGILNDVELTIFVPDGAKKTWRCHSAVLAAHSKILSEHIQKTKVTKSEDKNKNHEKSAAQEKSYTRKVEIIETLPECLEVFPQLLEYFYTGKVRVCSKTALPLLVLADRFLVSPVRKICDQFIASLINDCSVSDAVDWLKWAASYNLRDVMSKIVAGVLADFMFELPWRRKDAWKSLPFVCVEQIVKSDCLLVQNEFQIFQAIEFWMEGVVDDDGLPREDNTENAGIKSELSGNGISSSKNRVRGKNEAQKLVKNIRFQLMTGVQLLKVERSFISKLIPEITTQHLNNAYRYHILNQQHFGNNIDLDRPRIISGRDYLDVQWCTPVLYQLKPEKTGNFDTRNDDSKKSLNFSTSFDGYWQIEVKKYYNSVNLVVVLKRPLERIKTEYKIWLSIVVEDDQGRPSMRLRRRPLVIDNNSFLDRDDCFKKSQARTRKREEIKNTQRKGTRASYKTGIKMSSSLDLQKVMARNSFESDGNLDKEFFAIDNILSEEDFKKARSISYRDGCIRFGVIIRLETCELN